MSTTELLEKRNYRIPEFLKLYGIGRTTFYSQVKTGRIQILKVGRTTLISREAAEAWQAALEAAA